MLVGTILLTSMWGATLNGWTIMYGISIFIFAFGVGGEYPMTSTTSMEKYRGREDRVHRGRNVLLAFLMQGWGQLANQVALIVLLLLFNRSIESTYDEIATQLTFRISFPSITAGSSVAAASKKDILHSSSRQPCRYTPARATEYHLDLTSPPCL